MTSLFRGGKGASYTPLREDDSDDTNPAGYYVEMQQPPPPQKQQQQRGAGGNGGGGGGSSGSRWGAGGERVSGVTMAEAVRALPRDSRELDGFLMEVYRYYEGQGKWTILLRRLMNLLVVGYVVVFTTFLAGCVDYQELFSSHSLSDSVSLSYLRDMHWYLALALVLFSLFWLWHFLHLFTQFRPLSRIHHFYADILAIPEADLETIQWTDVVKRIVEVYRTAPDAAFKLDEYGQETEERGERLLLVPFADVLFCSFLSLFCVICAAIANRILRKDNYLTGLFNKELLDLKLRFSPFVSTPPLFSFSFVLFFCVLKGNNSDLVENKAAAYQVIGVEPLSHCHQLLL